jgi:hypothetical protein
MYDEPPRNALPGSEPELSTAELLTTLRKIDAWMAKVRQLEEPPFEKVDRYREKYNLAYNMLLERGVKYRYDPSAEA